jgi:hypothetical protein
MFFVALGVLSLVEALRLRDSWQGAKLMPAALAVVFVALGIGHLVPSSADAARASLEWPDAATQRRVILMFAVLVAYVAALPYLGFLPATALFVLVLLRSLGTYSWGRTLVLAAVMAVVSHVVFIHWLGMPLPAGPFGV